MHVFETLTPLGHDLLSPLAPPLPSTPTPTTPTPQVHRHHPPAVYGRTMGGAPETSEGAAVYKVEAGPSGAPAYGFITYQ